VLQRQGKRSDMATLAANEVAGYSNFIKAQGFLDYLKKFELNDQSEFYPIIYKICSHLNSKEELEELAKFLNKIYEKGYYKSVADHKAALKAHGLSTNISV
jgi:hypothetical protein